jgi:predicted amidohydrolase YtcJ
MSSHFFRNGSVYTVDPLRPWAESVVVRDERIVHVGAEVDAGPFVDAATLEIDLEGGCLLPGFIDGHDHLIEGALMKVGLSLDGLHGRADVLDAVAAHVAGSPGSGAIRGFGWTPFTFGEDGLPRRQWLDAHSADRPALMISYDNHDGWANSEALRRAGIDAATPDPNPPTSFYAREPDGAPSGACCEPEAWSPVAAALGAFDDEAYVVAMNASYWPAPSWGITTYFDAGVLKLGLYPERLDALYRRLMAYDLEQGLPVRIVGSHPVRDPNISPQAAVERLRTLQAQVRSPLLSVTTLKVFVDGVGPTHTAALLEPYSDRPGERGACLIDPDRVRELVCAANGAGFDVHLHCCGDRAVRVALDAIEAAQSEPGPRQARNTVCHLELLHPDDLPRFAGLGVTANGTPLWATDYRGEFCDFYPGLIGPERFQRDYLPYGSLFRSGARVTFGADLPGVEVDEIAPLVQIEAAVTRQRPGRPDDRVCSPEGERLPLESVLRCYTINGARALRLEDEIGSIEVGKRADLVSLTANPFEVPPQEIHAIGVRNTMLSGRFTFGGPEAEAIVR